MREQLKKTPSPRLYLQLADELRAAGRGQESIVVLREGVEKFPRYLSSRINLGKTLYAERAYLEAVEVMQRVLEEDPENIIAIRVLAQSWEAMGEKVEAIKKFKLLRIFLPGDEDLLAKIEALEQELNPPATPKERKLKRLEAFGAKMARVRSL